MTLNYFLNGNAREIYCSIGTNAVNYSDGNSIAFSRSYGNINVLGVHRGVYHNNGYNEVYNNNRYEVYYYNSYDEVYYNNGFGAYHSNGYGYNEVYINNSYGYNDVCINNGYNVVYINNDYGYDNVYVNNGYRVQQNNRYYRNSRGNRRINDRRFKKFYGRCNSCGRKGHKYRQCRIPSAIREVKIEPETTAVVPIAKESTIVKIKEETTNTKN